jgi:hypothetical protein
MEINNNKENWFQDDEKYVIFIMAKKVKVYKIHKRSFTLSKATCFKIFLKTSPLRLSKNFIEKMCRDSQGFWDSRKFFIHIFFTFWIIFEDLQNFIFYNGFWNSKSGGNPFMQSGFQGFPIFSFIKIVLPSNNSTILFILPV